MTREIRLSAWLRLLCASTAGVLLATACGCGEGAAPQRSVAPALESASIASERSAAPRPLRSGEIRLALHGGRIDLQVREATREAVLRRLADEAGIDLELGEMGPGGALARPAITLSLEGAEFRPDGRGWEGVLSALLEGIPYETAFAPDRRTGAHRVVALRVGPLASASAPAANPQPHAPAGLRDSILDAPLVPDGVAAAPSREEREAEEQRAAELVRLDDPDPERRARAVSFLSPTGDGLQQLRDVAAGDPEGRVRAAAVSRLGEGASYGAVEGLVAALSDPDAEVVLEAIDEISFQDDASLVTHLTPLLAHPDQRIAEAAGEAIEFLAF